MAELVALHGSADDWDVFVVDGLRLGALPARWAKTDVLGRRLPTWSSARAVKSIKPSERLEIANQLKGLSKERRQSWFEEHVAGSSLMYSERGE